MTQFFSQPEHQPFVMGESEEHGALLIHGFPGTPAELRPLGHHLAQAGISAHGLLLPGFGPDIVNLAQAGKEAWLTAVQSYWQQHLAQYPHKSLIGYSMGGALALLCAPFLNPDRLILLAPFWRMDGWQAALLPLLKYVKKTIYPFEKADFSNPATVKQLQELMPSANLDDLQTQKFIREQIQLPTAVLDDVRQLGQAAFRTAATVQKPTLILQGQRDNTVRPQDTRRLLQMIKGPVTYHEVKGDHLFIKGVESEKLPYFSHIASFL